MIRTMPLALPTVDRAHFFTSTRWRKLVTDEMGS